MKLTVNGKAIDLESPLTINAFLEYKGIKPGTVIVELNYEIPDRSKWQEIELKDGDNLEIVKFIGGG
jgi:sulfur carrier protein